MNINKSHLKFVLHVYCRKLKNREAAQTSRDRKKARMDELEKTVKYQDKQVKIRNYFVIETDSFANDL